MSPFRDQPTPFGSEAGSKYGSSLRIDTGGAGEFRQMRRRGADEESGGLELQMTPVRMGFAR
jgi:hypothetical protein